MVIEVVVIVVVDSVVLVVVPVVELTVIVVDVPDVEARQIRTKARCSRMLRCSFREHAYGGTTFPNFPARLSSKSRQNATVD